VSKQMNLLKLTLKNFKGIRNFTLEADGENISAFGDNATGKTTLFDAFVWLLFDKDSNNRKDFDIKTLDKNNNVLHGLEHEVEGVFDINSPSVGKQVTLRKVYAEKWTKKRGSVKQEFTGHTTNYFIDGVPVKKNEYEDMIASIIKEDVFKLLTSPSYFNEQLKKEDRRKVLMEVCGDITDEEVIASDKSLAKLPDILNGRKLEDHKKVIAEKRKDINKELDKIPVRIDEVYQGLPDISDVDVDDIRSKISTLSMQKETKGQELSSIQSGGQIAEKQRELAQIETEIINIKNEHRQKNDDVISQKRQEFFRVKDGLDRVESDIARKEREIESNNQSIKRLEKRAEGLRSAWHAVNDRKFEFDQKENCPSCGQFLPEESLVEARDKALSNFNRKKAQELEDIATQGKALKEEIENLKGYNVTLENGIKALREKAISIEKECENIQEEMESLKSQSTDITENDEYNAKLKEKEAIEHTIADLRADATDTTNSIKNEIGSIHEEIRTLEVSLARVDQYKAGQKRIEELQLKEKDLAAEYEKLEEELYLTEQFIRTKVNLLEEKINSRFKYARFKLFETQVNGGLNEICETLYKGVPYSSGLNNAARINVGLDIINTLLDYYGFSAPIFVDNAEAVTQLIDTKAQVISLVVSEKDKQLRVEHEKTEVKEAV
jgi:DNA repair exonuclease SbcCD ATPase subunit